MREILGSFGSTCNHCLILSTTVKERRTYPRQVPNIFNEFFTSIGSKLSGKINPQNKKELSNLEDALITKPIGNFYQFYQLLEIIKRIVIHKASGVHRRSTFLLKISFRLLVHQTLHLYNQIITPCNIPRNWKKVIVTPVYKAGPPGIPDN